MAEEEQGADAPAKKSKRLLLIIIVVLLLAAGGGGAFFFMSKNSADETKTDTPKEAVTPEKLNIVYVNLVQPFVFNVSGKQGARMVQIKVQLMVRGDKNEQLARYHTPLIENSLLSTFASTTVEQLRTPTGRVELRDRAGDDLKTTLKSVVGQPVIEKVLFTDFVIQ